MQKLITGRIGKPYGLKGFLRIYTENTIENLKKEGTLTLRKGNSEFLAPVSEIYETADKKYIAFTGCSTPEAARKAYTDCEVLVSRENARPLSDENEVYCADLIGLDVLFGTENVGKVRSWMEGAGSILLEITANDGKDYLVPYSKAFVSAPDFENRTIEIYMEDLLK